jgi:hypothetical protein
MSRKDAKAKSLVLCFLGGSSREFWDGSAICVTEMFRIKNLSIVLKKIDRITGFQDLQD